MTDCMQPIRLEGVQFEWQAGIPVIDISSFRLKLGSRCFLKGPSGTGKTTLLGLIGGVLLPNKGSVNILNTEINLLPISKRDTFRANHIGYIFQQFNLIPYLTVLNNVILPASFSPLRSLRSIQKSGSIEKEAIRLLARLGLQGDDILHRPVTGLSIGQQQRVAAARALLGCPEIIIADEPTSSLDYRNRESFLELLFEECSEGGSTLLFVSHDSTLEGLFDQVITLDSVNHADLAKQEIC